MPTQLKELGHIGALRELVLDAHDDTVAPCVVKCKLKSVPHDVCVSLHCDHMLS